ncbi:roadblock/LC7 domain-containing protein [Actinomadura darangshiensis]|uniref:Roadblock/LC7 domain-containing protein n=1 Tax=Actinomadura darangshiensis TaxID=705336 RepID=A0A4R4ZNP0_9ACTN|nr:roadblock/LC7 domain-containing protein [Actinomadura darangshiensis]TDD60245.1 roadblock/LC7 domain-containing protein [Actinomadura darangshiensis]
MLVEVLKVPGVIHALVATADGLVKQRSDGLADDAAERLAAACAGLNSVAQSVAKEHVGDGVMRRVVLELTGAALFVRGAGDGSHLAVLTDTTVDPGLIAQQMGAQVLKIGESNLSTPARNPGPAATEVAAHSAGPAGRTSP